MDCVLGVLKTAEGLRVRDEMLSWLRRLYDVVTVEQDVPGVLYEYPALALAFDMSAKLDEPVLYLHTKGAANPHKAQEDIRAMWKKQFGDEYARQKYLDLISTESPTISTPLVSTVGKCTWFNAFFVNPAAARILRETVKPSEDRYVFESVARDTDVEVVSPYPACEAGATFSIMAQM